VVQVVARRPRSPSRSTKSNGNRNNNRGPLKAKKPALSQKTRTVPTTTVATSTAAAAASKTTPREEPTPSSESPLVEVLRCVGGSLLDPSRFGLNVVVGMYKLTQLTDLESSWFFSTPCTYEMKNCFSQSLLVQIQLVPLHRGLRAPRRHEPRV
jgi:hypothetical protein